MWKRDYFYRKAECTGCFRRGGIPGTIVLDIRCSFSYLMVTIVAP